MIGASTGGIEALMQVLSDFPEDAPPTVIVQHINGAFIPGLSDRLDRHCAPSVRAAENNDRLQPGRVLIAPGNTRHLVISPDGRRCQFDESAPQSGHRPSADALLLSAAAALGPNAVGGILSGMGRDGATGRLQMRQRGAWTIGQDRQTSVLYGMPRVAAEEGALIEELPLHMIGSAVLKAASHSGPANPTQNARNAQSVAASTSGDKPTGKKAYYD